VSASHQSNKTVHKAESFLRRWQLSASQLSSLRGIPKINYRIHSSSPLATTIVFSFPYIFRDIIRT